MPGREGRCKEPWGTVHQISGALSSVLGLLSFSAGLLLGGQTVLANGQLKETEGTAGGNRPHLLAVLSICPRNTRMKEFFFHYFQISVLQAFLYLIFI